MSGIGSQAAKRKGHRLFSMSIVAIAAGALLGAGAARDAGAQGLTINIVDVAGNLALTQDAFELYAKKNPGKVAKFVFTKAPAPELPGKLKAMQAAGRSDIDEDRLLEPTRIVKVSSVPLKEAYCFSTKLAS